VSTTIAEAGGPAELGMIFDSVVAREAMPVKRQVALMGMLERAARQRKVYPAGDLGRVGKLLDVPDEGLRTQAARAAGLWHVEVLRPRLLGYTRAAATPAPMRQAAVEGLALLGGEASRRALDELATSGHSLPVRGPAVVALAAIDL